MGLSSLTVRTFRADTPYLANEFSGWLKSDTKATSIWFTICGGIITDCIEGTKCDTTMHRRIKTYKVY